MHSFERGRNCEGKKENHSLKRKLKQKFDIPSGETIMLWLKYFVKEKSYTKQEVYDLMCKYKDPRDYMRSLKNEKKD